MSDHLIQEAIPFHFQLKPVLGDLNYIEARERLLWVDALCIRVGKLREVMTA